MTRRIKQRAEKSIISRDDYQRVELRRNKRENTCNMVITRNKMAREEKAIKFVKAT